MTFPASSQKVDVESEVFPADSKLEGTQLSCVSCFGGARQCPSTLATLAAVVDETCLAKKGQVNGRAYTRSSARTLKCTGANRATRMTVGTDWVPSSQSRNTEIATKVFEPRMHARTM